MFNKDFFKEWSPNMAYVLGFWFTKGTIYKERSFEITVPAKDKYILKQIAKQLGYEAPLQDPVNKQIYKINFYCEAIVQDILKLVGHSRVFPDIPNQYLSDFIRGLLDGGGQISQLKGNRLNLTFSGLSYYNCKVLDLKLNEVLQTAGSIDKEHYLIKFGNKDSIKIGNYIYQNNPELFLERKKLKFIS